MLRTRILTAVVLLPVLLGGMFFLSPEWWAVLMLPLLIAGAWEWGRLTGLGIAGKWIFCVSVPATAFAMLLAVRHFGMSIVETAAYWASVSFWLIMVPAWLRQGWHVKNRMALWLAGWLLLVPTWLALMRLQDHPWVLLAVMGVVWVADIAAYFAGHTWGRHKLAPMISPGKTWEGVMGAAVGVTVYYVTVWHSAFSSAVPGYAAAVAALVFCMLPLSILGDLFESWIKRQAGVKDSGNLLPGHGGVLDRIDGLTSTLPLAALVVSWIFQGP